MQTFLPYKDFNKCAEVLDNKRLYKQIVECKQILKAIENRKSDIKAGWVNHPCVIMWENDTRALKYYQWCMLKEWAKRRYGFDIYEEDYTYVEGDEEYGHDFKEIYYDKMPAWLNDEELHKSHRLNLLYKDSEHYSKYFKEDIPTSKPQYKWILGDEVRFK